MFTKKDEMAQKPKPMEQVKQLLILLQQGRGKKFISNALGISTNTVREYRKKVEGLGIGIDELLKLEGPVLEKKLFAGSPAYKDKRYDELKEKLDYFTKELTRPGVTKFLLWQEYKESCPNGYSKSQFYHHLKQHIKASRPSMVLGHKPAEKLFVDFAGDKLHYVDTTTGELVACNVFVACLPYSDYSFAMAVKQQTIEDFLHALRGCLEDMGGVPEILVPDNLKAAVTKASRYEPDINRTMEDFANHYGFAVVPARARRPKDKALVENQVKIIYSRVYAKLRNGQFHSIKELNKAIKEKIKQHNQTRMQAKPWSREEKFLAEERRLLGRLPKEGFEIKYYGTLKVQKNNHVYLGVDKHYYSVPYQHIGQEAKVRYTRSMVHIFVNGEQVAVHRRDYRQGRYTTEERHLCSAHRAYKDRSPEHYIKKAYGRHDELGQYFEEMFKQPGRHPEQLYRSCDGILSLEKKEKDKKKFKAACRIALDYEIYGYGHLKRVLGNNANFTEEAYMEQEKDNRNNNGNKPQGQQGAGAGNGQAGLPKHGNIRGGAYYKKSLLATVKQLSLKLFTL